MRLVIVSGLSGSGKTVALNTLEDDDYYCVDNMPLGLLPDFLDRVLNRSMQPYENIAVGIDARSETRDLLKFHEMIKPLRKPDIDIQIIYLQSEVTALIKRFSDTRRKHPLTTRDLPLSEAIEVERKLLSSIAAEADLYLDTTYTNVHQLHDLIKERVIKHDGKKLSLLFQSFGFKHGAPTDSDFVFDVRCLPNPHWEPNLRPLTGLDEEVIKFLKSEQEVQEMQEYICNFLQYCIPKFERQNRHYLTISIGCTGGQHRSVFLAQQLFGHFRELADNVSVRHREML